MVEASSVPVCLLLLAVVCCCCHGRTVMVEPGDPSKTLFVLAGDSFTLACRDNQAKPILWEKNGSPISTYGSRRPLITSWMTTEYHTKVSLTSLIVREAGVADEGVYGCSSADERPQTVNVVVLSLHTVDAQLTGRWAEGHNEAVLKCDPDKAALFDAFMYWFKDGEKVAPAPDDIRVMLLDNNRTLYFRDLHYPQDAAVIGKYECMMKLPSRGRTYFKRAYVKAAAIIDSVSAEEDADGNVVSVHCRGHAYPVPEVTWRKDGHLFSSQSEKYSVSTAEDGASGGFVSTLAVRDWGRHDHGNYTCVADALREDYVMDDSSTLVIDEAYYASIAAYKVNTAGLVIGALIGCLVLLYIIVVIIIVIIIQLKKRNKQGKLEVLPENGEGPAGEDTPMLDELLLGTPRPRRGTVSETNSLGLPMNNLGSPPSELDDSTHTKTTNHSGSANSSLHKDLAPPPYASSSSSSSNSPTGRTQHPIIDVDPVAAPAPLLETDLPMHDSSLDSVDGGDIPPATPLTGEGQRPPSLHDILESERQRSMHPSSCDDSDDDDLAPPLPPKQKTLPRNMEYLEMGGNNNNNRWSAPPPNSNGSLRRLGDSPLREDESSIDGDNAPVETEAVIETRPMPTQYSTSNGKYSTFV